MKLYYVAIEFHGDEDAMVLADNAKEAGALAVEGAVFDYVEARVANAYEVDKLNDIPSGWHSCTPVAAQAQDNSFTCADWVLQIEQRRQREESGRPDPKQLTLKIPKEKS